MKRRNERVRDSNAFFHETDNLISDERIKARFVFALNFFIISSLKKYASAKTKDLYDDVLGGYVRLCRKAFIKLSFF